MHNGSQLSNSFIIIYFTISIAIALQIGGTNWDIIWHGINDIDNFLTPPHLVLYSGVLLVILLNIIGIYIWHKNQISNLQRSDNQLINFNFVRSIPTGLKLSITGSLLEISSGFFDSWWHSNFGFDGLLSPSHLMIGTGMMIAILGVLVGINRDRFIYSLHRQKKLLKITKVITYSVLWMVFINISFMFTLPYSEGQVFNFNPDPLLAIITSIIVMPIITIGIFFHALRTLEGRFIFSSITGIFMIIQSISSIISNQHFASLLPLYILNIIPAVICDIILNYNKKRISKVSHYKKYFQIFNIIPFIIIPVFLVTLYFPWSVNIYKIQYGINEDTFQSVDTFNKLFSVFILPILIPSTILVSFSTIMILNKLSSKKLSYQIATDNRQS